MPTFRRFARRRATFHHASVAHQHRLRPIAHAGTDAADASAGPPTTAGVTRSCTNLPAARSMSIRLSMPGAARTAATKSAEVRTGRPLTATSTSPAVSPSGRQANRLDEHHGVAVAEQLQPESFRGNHRPDRYRTAGPDPARESRFLRDDCASRAGTGCDSQRAAVANVNRSTMRRAPCQRRRSGRHRRARPGCQRAGERQCDLGAARDSAEIESPGARDRDRELGQRPRDDDDRALPDRLDGRKRCNLRLRTRFVGIVSMSRTYPPRKGRDRPFRAIHAHAAHEDRFAEPEAVAQHLDPACKAPRRNARTRECDQYPERDDEGISVDSTVIECTPGPRRGPDRPDGRRRDSRWSGAGLDPERAARHRRCG